MVSHIGRGESFIRKIPGPCDLESGCLRQNEKLEIAANTCAIEYEINQCDEFAKEFPEYASLIKTCDIKSVCEEANSFLLSTIGSCTKGAINLLKDQGKMIVDGVIDGSQFIHNKWLEMIEDLKTPLNQKQNKKKSEISMAEVVDELDELGTSISETIKKTNIKHNCFKLNPKKELECYVLSGAVDPAIIIGFALKLATKLKHISSNAAAVTSRKKFTENNNDLTSRSFATRKKNASNEFRANFKKKYDGNYSPTTPEQNDQWIKVAELNRSDPNRIYFDIENSQMKKLNDTLKDKDYVTSVTNYHKELIFNKIKELEKKYPGLNVDKYSDFKSSRFSFSGVIPEDFDKILNQIQNEANHEFKQFLIDSKLIRAQDGSQNWFRSGIGTTADEATLASRYSRESPYNVIQNYNNPKVIESLNKSLHQSEKLRLSTLRDFDGTNVIDNGTLHVDAFDILRKNTDNLDNAKQELANRFGITTIPDKTIQNMSEYVKYVDKFSPGIHVRERLSASLDDALHGGITADMVGLGAKNLKATAEALKDSKNLNNAIDLSRLNEKAVTKGFEEKKAAFSEALSDSFGKERIKTICSGDDCVVIPNFQLSSNDKQKLLNTLAEKGYSSDFRISFVAPKIEQTLVRNQLGNHGEGIEKILRKNLSQSMEPNLLKRLTFGIDMQTSELNQGKIKLFIGNPNNSKLKPAEMKQIENAFNQSIDIFNESQKKNNIESRYWTSK